jgi:hypothetical protein
MNYDEMTPQEQQDYAASVAYDNYKADLCELEMNLHEAAMKWFDRKNQSSQDGSVYGLAVLHGIGSTYEDYLRWKNPPPPDTSLPF